MAMKNTDRDAASKEGRRRFVKNVLLAGGGAAALAAGGLGPLRRLAQGADGPDERFYVFAYFSGGWDTLLGLDPRDPSAFTDDNVGQSRIMPGYGQQTAAEFQAAPTRTSNGILLGPAAQPLARMSDRLAVVRGMSMDTLTHEVGRRRFITGKPPSGLNARGSAATAYLADQFDGSRLIPNLSVRVESFNPDLPSEVSALRVGSSSDLVTLLRRANPVIDPTLDDAIAELHAGDATCARAQSSPLLRSAESARRRMHAVLDADVQALFDFGVAPASIEDPALRAKMELLHSHFDLAGGNNSQEQAALAGQALAQGVARVVSFQAAGGLDTHFDDWEDEQGPRQRDGFEAIARLAEYLEAVPCGDSGESMLDRTTIVAFSEFMRTPLINARGGRDHWLTNSCMLLGGKIAPGEYGASSDIGMSPQPLELASGRAMPGAEETGPISVVRPEHVLQTLFVDAGMDPVEDRADMRVPPIPALLRS